MHTIFICINTLEYIYIYIYIYIHIHTHTHTYIYINRYATYLVYESCKSLLGEPRHRPLVVQPRVLKRKQNNKRD